MQLVRTALPTKTCVTVANVKANERIRHSEEDELIGRHIKAAEGFIEKATQRAIMQQTFDLTTNRLAQSLQLFYPPMEGPITLKAASARLGDQNPVDYDVDLLRVAIVDQLPSVRFSSISAEAARRAGEMTISYETGAATVDQVPADVQQAVLLLASYFYKAREAATSDSRVTTIDKALPFGVRQLIAPYRIRNVNAPYYEERPR